MYLLVCGLIWGVCCSHAYDLWIFIPGSYVQGHDRRGRLVLVQMEGETWSSGVDLYELADLLVELGGA